MRCDFHFACVERVESECKFPAATPPPKVRGAQVPKDLSKRPFILDSFLSITPPRHHQVPDIHRLSTRISGTHPLPTQAAPPLSQKVFIVRLSVHRSKEGGGVDVFILFQCSGGYVWRGGDGRGRRRGFHKRR